jgi:type I restriction enzyme R subunit
MEIADYDARQHELLGIRMPDFDKKFLSEGNLCAKSITPALVGAGWDVQTQIRREVNLTQGRVIVSGRTYKRGEATRADHLLHCKPNRRFALAEAKDNSLGAHLIASTLHHRLAA